MQPFTADHHRRPIRQLLHKWTIEPDTTRVIRQLQAAGIDVVGIKRLHLGPIHSPNFGKIEIIPLPKKDTP